MRAQRVRDQVADATREVQELAGRLELEAAPGRVARWATRSATTLSTRLERLTRRREQLGPVNPLAQEEYAEALEHVEELERQRADLETALRELEKLIADTDKQIKETFEETFEAAARNFEELSEQLFPGGQGRSAPGLRARRAGAGARRPTRSDARRARTTRTQARATSGEAARARRRRTCSAWRSRSRRPARR